MFDALAFGGLLFLLFIHIQSAPMNPEATREAYDTKMREYVLAHELTTVKEEAIETRRLLRTTERRRQKQTAVTIGVLGLVVVYLGFRLYGGRRRQRMAMEDGPR